MASGVAATEAGRQCDASCCGSARLSSVTDYFNRGLDRRRVPMLPVLGDRCTDDNGLQAQFSLELEDDVITEVVFRASLCSTLIAYCEMVAGWGTGATLARAIRISPGDVAGALREVPPGKRDRARLAMAAWWSVIGVAVRGDRE